MRLVATAVGGGLIALLGLAIAKALLGSLVGAGLFLLVLFLKILFAALMIWLAVKLLKSLVKPAKADE
jgi:uncharacterized SAM-binding protein YcdF (DUF218 family)